MNFAVPGGNDAATEVGGGTLPSSDDAASSGDNRDKSQNIVRLELGLDHKIDVTCRKTAIGVTIAAIAREPHVLFDAVKWPAVVGAHQARAGGKEHGVLERPALSH